MSYESIRPNAPNELLKTLADPTRRGIFVQLMEGGEQTVGALTDFAGVSQPAVSKHLSVLKQAGLVQDRPAGRTVHYRAQPQGLAPLMNWLSFYSTFWTERFDRLEALLDAAVPDETLPDETKPNESPLDKENE